MGRLSDLYNDLSQQQAEAESQYIRTTTPGLRMPSPKPEPVRQTQEEEPGLLSDAWSSFGIGAGQLVKGAEWLFGTDTNIGQDTVDYWQGQLSDAQVEANEQRFVDEDMSLGEGFSNPRTWMGTIVQSLPMMVPGVGAAGGAARLGIRAGMSKGAATAAGAAAGSSVEGATIGALVGEEVEKTIMEAPIEELQNSPYFQDLIEAGKDEAEARLMVAEKASEGAALQSGVLGAILGVAFNKFVGDAVTGRLSERLLKETGKGALEGAGTELAQTGVESYSKQTAMNESLGRPYDYSEAANEMVGGTGAGGIMGGAVGFGGGLAGSNTPEPQEPVPEIQPEQPAAQPQQASRAQPSGLTPEAEPAFDDPLDNIGERYEQAVNQPPSIAGMGVNLGASQQPAQSPSQPLSEQVGTEQDPQLVYDQEGVQVRQLDDRRFEARSTNSDLAAEGRDMGEARRRLQQMIERNQPRAPVLQNRDRSDPGYIRQMEDIANNPDYDQVSASKTPDAGAPMVFPQGAAPPVPEMNIGRSETITMADGQGGTRKIRAQYAVVDADDLKASHSADGRQNEGYGRDGLIALNNGRTAGLQEAYNRGTAEAYKQAMKEDAQNLGIDPAAIDSKRKPVLVRLFDGAQLEGIDDPGAASNERMSADLSPVEQAQTDARKITPDVLAALNPGDPTGAGNADFVRSAISAIAGDNRKTDLRDRNGLLTAAGQKRIRGALVERAYSDQSLTRELVEATDSDLKTLGDALTEVAGRWALMRERANEGSINPDMDITDALVGAVNMIRKSRQEGRSLKDLASQVDAFAGEADQMAVKMLHLFYHGANYGRIRAKDTIAGALQGYIDSALATSPGPDMFGEMASPQDALESQREQVEGEKPQETAPRVSTDGADNRESGPQGEGRGRRAGREADAEDGRSEAEVTPEESPNLELETQTEEQLAEQERARQESEQAEARARREEERRADADGQVDSFTLTGSDRTADVAMAAGQDDIFVSTPASRKAEGAQTQRSNKGKAVFDRLYRRLEKTTETEGVDYLEADATLGRDERSRLEAYLDEQGYNKQQTQSGSTRASQGEGEQVTFTFGRNGSVQMSVARLQDGSTDDGQQPTESDTGYRKIKDAMPAHLAESFPSHLLRNKGSAEPHERMFPFDTYDSFDDIIKATEQEHPSYRNYEPGQVQPDGTIYTPENLVHTLKSLESGVQEMNGKLNKGVHRRGDSAPTPKKLLDAWIRLKQTENSVANSRAQHPEQWAAYDQRQQDLKGLKKGDRVHQPYLSPENPHGAVGEIVRKGPRNWRVSQSPGSPHSSLIPIEGLAPEGAFPAAGGQPSELEAIKNDDPYDQLETRPGTTEAQRSAGRSALRDLFRQLNARLGRKGRLSADGSGISLLGAAIYKNFKEGKPNQLIGQTVRTPRDLAALAQVYRDPRFETFRFILTKNGQVVSEQAITSRLPAAVSFQNIDATIADLKQSMADFEADGYYMLHNHPSGRSLPSKADEVFTTKISSEVPGFVNHVVVDTNEYSVISAKRGPVIPIETTQDDTLGSTDFWGNPESPHDVLGAKISDPKHLAEMAKKVQEPGRAVIIGTTARGEVSLLTSLPRKTVRSLTSTSDLKARREVAALIRRTRRASGTGGYLFMVVEGEAEAKAFAGAVYDGVVRDIVTPDGFSLAGTRNISYFKDVMDTLPKKTMRIAEDADNYQPTDDLRFSRTGPRNLFVAHNLSEQNLEYVMELGGLAAPSLAVGRTDQGFSDFGEITLLAPASMLESSRARTFDADVYTPRQPRPEYQIDRDALQSQIEGLDNEYDLAVPAMDDLERDGMEAMARSPAYQYAWLKSKGRAPKAKRKQVAPAIRKMANLNLNRYEMLSSPKALKLAEDHFRKEYEKFVEVVGEADAARESLYFDEDGSLKSDRLYELALKAEQYKNSGGYDTAQMKHDLQKKMRPKIARRQYEKWIKEQFNEVVKGRRMFDGFTASGNRRYQPYTMENIVKMMTRHIQGGEGFNYGAGSVRSSYAKEMKRISQVQANRDRIVSPDEMERIKDESNERLMEVLSELKPYYRFDASSWGYTDDASSAIGEGPKGWNEAFDLDAEGRAIITEFVDYLRNLPTAYFETKVGRAVDLAEFSVAIVPKGTSQETVDILRAKGLKVKRYDPADPDSRRQEIAKQEDLLFSKSGDYRRTPDSRIESLTAEEARTISNDLMKGWKGRPGVTVADRISEFPADLRAAIRLAKAEGDMRAVFWNDHVYILAPRIPNTQALEEVILHEVVGHYGLRKMVGKELIPLLNRVYMDMARTEQAAEIKRNYFPGNTFDSGNREHRLVVAEELLAHLAESGKQRHRTLWQRIVTAIRNGLRRLGFTVSMNENDLLKILEGAQRTVEQGGFSRPSEADTYFRRAYHGTPHRFDKFSLEAIGTGEGAQAFGWGLYFAGNRSIAEYYQRVLSSGRGLNVPRARPLSQAPSRQERDAVNKAEQTFNRVLGAYATGKQGRVSWGGNLINLYNYQNDIGDLDAKYYEKNHEEIEQEIESAESAVKKKNPNWSEAEVEKALSGMGFYDKRNPFSVAYSEAIKELPAQERGNLYEVEIPDDSDLLDRDALLSEQPEKVQQALRKLPGETYRKITAKDVGGNEPTGSLIYNRLQEYFSRDSRDSIFSSSKADGAKDASQELNDVGIPGLRYLDNTSRGQGEGTHNYVIWDESVVSVQAVNDEIAQAEAYFSRTDQTQTEAFSKWFGDSKVVDENGEPLVVYHGTNAEFNQFDMEYAEREDNWSFTDDIRVANTYRVQSIDPEKAWQAFSSATDAQKEAFRDELAQFKDDGTTDQEAMQAWAEVANSDEPELWAYDFSQAVGVDQNEIYGQAPVGQMVSAYLRLENPVEYWYDENGNITRTVEPDGEPDGYIHHNKMDTNSPTTAQYTSTVYQVFDSTQIKSATGNAGTFDPTNPDIRFSRAGNKLDAAATHFNDLTDDQRAALGKIAPRTPKERAQDWLRERTDRWQTKVRQGAVDRFAALADVDVAVHGRDVIENSTASSSWVLAQMSGSAAGALQSMLTTSRIKLNQREKVITTRDGTEGLNDTLKQLGSAAEIERFFGWIAGNRSRRLMAEGRENLFEPQEVEALAQLNRGTTDNGQSRLMLYDNVFREFQQYRDDVLAIAEQSGIITPEQRDTWANEFYVPFYRLAEDDGSFTGPKATGGISRQEAYKKLKGGTRPLNDLLENTMMNFHHLLQASLKNQAAMQAMDNSQEMGIAREVREADRDTENSTFILRDGQKIWYEIDDPLVFKAVTALAHPGMNSAAMKMMRGFKRLFTNLTTTTPQFVIANLLRDSMQAAATSEVSKNILKNMAQGSKVYGDPKIRAKMLASGGSFSFGHLYGENADELRLRITGGLAQADILRSPSMIPNAISGMWRKWNEMTEFTENINRAAIFEQNQDRGDLYAAFKARDLMNFSQHGAWPAMRVLIDVVPFLNARLQGLDKIYRSGVKPGLRTAMGQGTASEKQAAMRFWSVTGTLALASIALYLNNRDDEEYKKLEEWQKDTYWFFRISDDHAIFIPKPFEVGAIATMAERLTEQAVSDTATGKLFADRLSHMLLDTFSFSPVPQMFQPVLDIYSNYDAFTGRPIESMGMERLSPSLRRRNNTTALATGLSAATESVFGSDGRMTLSPVQIDHAIQGYFGSVGSWVAGITDTIWRTASGETAPSTFWYENQPVRRFYKNLGNEDRYTRYGTVFYEALKETNRVYADIMEYAELGEVEKARALYQENRNKLAYRVILNRVQRKLSDINSAMQKVRRLEASPEYKRRELDRLRAIKNRIQEAVGGNLERLNASGS